MLSNSQKRIRDKCKQIEEMLIYKNSLYGDSALNPLRIFSKASPKEQINVRIDDKLSRIANSLNMDDEDSILDLTGYLILLLVSREHEKTKKVNNRTIQKKFKRFYKSK